MFCLNCVQYDEYKSLLGPKEGEMIFAEMFEVVHLSIFASIMTEGSQISETFLC